MYDGFATINFHLQFNLFCFLENSEIFDLQKLEINLLMNNEQNTQTKTELFGLLYLINN